jgi:hypothetical protein
VLPGLRISPQEFSAAIAADLGVDPSQIAALTVSAGSVVVTFQLLPADDTDRFEPATLDTLVATVRTPTTNETMKEGAGLGGRLEALAIAAKAVHSSGVVQEHREHAHSAKRPKLDAASGKRCSQRASVEVSELKLWHIIAVTRAAPDVSLTHAQEGQGRCLHADVCDLIGRLSYALTPPAATSRHPGDGGQPNDRGGAGLRHADVGGDHSCATARRRRQAAAARRRRACRNQGAHGPVCRRRMPKQSDRRTYVDVPLHSAATHDATAALGLFGTTGSSRLPHRSGYSDAPGSGRRQVFLHAECTTKTGDVCVCGCVWVCVCV